MSKMMNCPNCGGVCTLGSNIEEDKVNYPQNLCFVFIECRNCDNFLAEYVIRSNGNVLHIDGEEPFETYENKFPKK